MRLALASVVWFVLFWFLAPAGWGESTYAAPLYGWLSFIPPILLHGSLAIGGVYLFQRTFKPKSWLWTILIVPYVAVASFQVSAALPPFILLLVFSSGGAWAGLAYLARTEWIVLAFLGRSYRYSVLVAVAIVFAMTGWVVSPNSPVVAYISLGQLPNNIWGIEYKDEFAATIAQKYGYASQYDCPELFRGAFIDSVAAHPLEYVKKCAYNGMRVALAGVWVGDIPKPYRFIGQALFGAVFLLSTLMVWVRRPDRYREALLILGLIVLAQILGQQMARHMNPLYLPMLGLAWCRK